MKHNIIRLILIVFIIYSVANGLRGIMNLIKIKNTLKREKPKLYSILSRHNNFSFLIAYIIYSLQIITKYKYSLLSETGLIYYPYDLYVLSLLTIFVSLSLSIIYLIDKCLITENYIIISSSKIKRREVIGYCWIEDSELIKLKIGNKFTKKLSIRMKYYHDSIKILEKYNQIDKV